MTGLSAVEIVLSEKGTPMTAEEITAEILSRGYWQTTGRTPDATISAQLAVDIKSNGTTSKFQRTGPNLFALRSWGLPEFIREPKQSKQDKPEVIIEPELASQINQHNKIFSSNLRLDFTPHHLLISKS